MQKPEEDRNHQGPPSPESDVHMDIHSEFHSPRFFIPSSGSQNHPRPPDHEGIVPQNLQKRYLQNEEDELCSAEVDSCSNEELTEKIKMMKQRIKDFKINEHPGGGIDSSRKKKEDKTGFGPNFANSSTYKSFETANFNMRLVSEGTELSPRQSTIRQNEGQKDSYAHLTNSMLEDRINEIKKRMHEVPSEERSEQDAASGNDLARFKNSKLFQKFIKKEKSENEAKLPTPSSSFKNHLQVQQVERSNDEKQEEKKDEIEPIPNQDIPELGGQMEQSTKTNRSEPEDCEKIQELLSQEPEYPPVPAEFIDDFQHSPPPVAPAPFEEDQMNSSFSQQGQFEPEDHSTEKLTESYPVESRPTAFFPGAPPAVISSPPQQQLQNYSPEQQEYTPAAIPLSTIPPESAQRFPQLPEQSFISHENELMGYSEQIQPVGNRYPQYLPPMANFPQQAWQPNPAYSSISMLPMALPQQTQLSQNLPAQMQSPQGIHQIQEHDESSSIHRFNERRASAHSRVRSSHIPQPHGEDSFNWRNQDLEVQLNNANEEVGHLREKVQHLEKEFLQNNEENLRLNQEFEKSTTRIEKQKMKNELLMQEIEELRRELETKEGGGGSDFGEAQMLREDIEVLKRQNQEKNILQVARIEQLQKQLDETERNVSMKLITQADSAKRGEMDMRSKFDNLNFQHQRYQEKYSELINQQEAVLKREDDLKAQISGLKKQLIESEGMLGLKIDEEVTLKKELDSRKLESERNKTNEMGLQRQLTDRQHQIACMQTELNEVKQRVNNEQNQNRILSTENESLRSQNMLIRNQLDMQRKVNDQLKDESFTLKQTISEYEKREMLSINQTDTLQRELNQARMQLNFINQRLQSQGDAYIELQNQFNTYVQSGQPKTLAQRNVRQLPTQEAIPSAASINMPLPTSGISVSGDRDSILPPSSVISNIGGNRPISGDSARANIGEIPQTSSRPNDIGTSRTDDRSRSGYSAFLGGGGSRISEAKRMPPSFSMVPGIPQQSAASLSSTGSSADMAISSAREQASIARRNNNQTSSVLANAFSWNPPEESKPLPAHRFGSHGQQQPSLPQQNYPVAQSQQPMKSQHDPGVNKKRGGFNFLPQREVPTSSMEQTKQGEIKQPPRQQALLPAQEEQLKKQNMIKNIENKLMMLQMEKEKVRLRQFGQLSAQFEKIPESAKTIKDRKRRGELEMELGILGTNISSLKQKLRGLNALHKEY